jgi:GH24 family phage-related lysozyme (muramidase)
MAIPKQCIDLVKSFEGFHTALPDGSCKAYLDKLAKPPIWTIGWGCTEGVHPGMVWTKEEAELALMRELEKHAAIVDRCVTVDIGENNRAALISFQYNCGALPKSTLLRKLNAGDFDGAAREFDRWNKAGGKVYKGLVRRRAAERAMFEMDARDAEIPEGEPDMPQAVEPQPEPVSRTTVAVSTGAAGAAGSAVIPQVPSVVTESAGNAEAWQQVGLQIGGLLKFAVTPMGLAIVAGTAALLFLPRLFGRSA